MSGGAPGHVEIVAIGSSAAEAVVWRTRGELRVTVLVKACFGFEADAPMRALEPEEILRADVHHGRNPSRSVWLTNDLAPYLPRADVILTGHACAPAGQTVDGMSVRLAVYGDGPLLDRSINVHGDRANGAVTPFERVPLVYERAHGGIGVADNPFGVGAGDDGRQPNLVDPADPLRAACFGPIGRSWPARRKLLRAADRQALEGPVIELPAGFDFTYFQAAPPEQQIGYLVGNEWVVLEGVHPVEVQIASSLPSAIGRARVFGLGPGPGRALALVADTLRIDGDTLTCQVVWRGSFPIPALSVLDTLAIYTGVETADAPLDWPAPPPSLAAPFSSAPFSMPASASSVPASASPAPPPPPAPSAADRAAWDRTVEIPPEVEEQAAAGPAIPFHEGVAQLPPATAAPPPRGGEWSATVTITDDDERRPSLPFPHEPRHGLALSPGLAPFPTLASSPEPGPPPAPAYSHALAPSPPPAPSHPPSGFDIEPPTARFPPRARPASAKRPRAGEGMELSNETPLAFGALRWESSPPRDCLTIVAKATCDLVPGGPAALQPKAEPLRDDRLLEGAPAPVCLYPSDLARFKVRADVMLTGHAHAPPGGATSMKVRFRFGEAPAGFDRTLLVFGERRWEKAGALAKPGAPAAFLRMPLRLDHAFGGPGHDENPAGIGHSGKIGRLPPLPHLEDPAERLRTPRQSPRPACFAPIPAAERERRARESKVLRSLADTVDWSRHQAAPRAQQLPFLRGDETFEIDGVHPQHAHFEGALPGIVARCLAVRPNGREEVPMRLDTAFFDLDGSTLTLVWRGLLPVADERSPDVRSLRLVTVPADERDAPIFD